METIFTENAIQQIIIYFCFGSILGTNLYWIGYGIVAGVKWIIEKFKKEKKTNE